jgi:urease accessory protein
MTLRATAFRRAGQYEGIPFDLVVLDHQERRLRRKLLTLVHGDEVLVDLPETTTFEGGDVLVLDDGRMVDIQAAEEKLYEIRARDMMHLAELAWHLGNRHLPAQILTEADVVGPRILIARDEIIRTMLIGLGAEVREVSEPFYPLQGAYHSHGHALLNR